MTTITLEGKEYLLDIEQAKKLGLLKKTDGRVRSWEKFKEKYITDIGYVYTEETNTNKTTSAPLYIEDQLTPHEAKALAAFSKLLKLRRDWIGEWEPDWNKPYDDKFIIYGYKNEIRICNSTITSASLSFPSYQLAQEFSETFHDLIEEAKTLI
jgi:hypothetical protein